MTDASDEEILPSLTTLPVDILSMLLHCCGPFNLRPDGTLELPPFAAVCSMLRSAALQMPEIDLKLADLRRSPSPQPDQSPSCLPSWQCALGTVRARLQPTALSLNRCCVDAGALRACAAAAEVSGRSFRALALRKCLTVTAKGLPTVLHSMQNLTSFVCTGHDLSRAPAVDALGELVHLRVLSLAECTIHAEGLLASLPKLSELRCLLLGGANLVRPSLDVHAFNAFAGAPSGIFSLNPPLHGNAGPVVADANGPMSAPTRVAGNVAALPHLRLLDVTFVHPSECARLFGLAPVTCLSLDLCARASPLDAGLRKLTEVLDATCGEGSSSVAEAARVATLSSRNAGFHETALHTAAVEGDAATCALLVSHGAAVDLKDAKGCTPLSRAIFEGHVHVARLLLGTGQCDLEQCNHAAENPTYLAALRGHAQCLELLLTCSRCAATEPGKAGGGQPLGAPPPAQRAYHDGYTPVHAAVISRSLRCLELLLSAGFPVSAQNKYLQTGLHIAASLEVRSGDNAPFEATERLLAAGCDATLKDERGQTALMVAQSRGHTLLAQLLQDHHRLTSAFMAPGGGRGGDVDGNGGMHGRVTANRDGGGRGRRRGSRRGRGGAGSSVPRPPHVAHPPQPTEAQAIA